MSYQIKEYPCGICGANDTKRLYVLKDFNIVKCNKCGFVYVNPRIANEDLPRLYSSDYFHNWEYGYKDYEATAHLRKKNFERWYKDIKPFLKVEKGNALDIGCASGYFLEVLRNEGWKVQGIELDPTTIEVLKTKNIPAYTKPFDTFESTEKFHLITLFDVLEHLPDIQDTFKRLSSLLHPDGIIALITPNADSTQHKLFGKRWFQLKPMEHIHYFSPSTLKRAAEPHDLKVVEIMKGGQYADVSFILNRLQQYEYKSVYKISSFSAWLFGLHKACFYTDTGSLFAILKKAS
jgi:2-polyprenyl-3-methyl-5-hydroxy-6-metoxy-1,4-benzoquinol methylase